MDIMIDLESLSLKPRAHVLSIGATAFNLATGEVRRELYVELGGMEQIACKRDISLSTVKWWVGQAITNPDAAALFMNEGSGVSDTHCLHLLNKFIADTEADEGGLSNIWANGPQADMIWLETLYEDMGLIVPWRYSQIRDFRTIRWLFREMGETLGPIEMPPFDGTPHNALHDARWQTRELVEMVKRIKGEA